MRAATTVRETQMVMSQATAAPMTEYISARPTAAQASRRATDGSRPRNPSTDPCTAPITAPTMKRPVEVMNRP